ncbi:RHS repeat-associated core domain-containing protein [Enterobacter asburiae]|nr:RHS repeat-associated core domain-containing protein [Enterobacter asburiae]
MDAISVQNSPRFGGRSLSESTPITGNTPQNLRLQGQYLDRETGLHYNFFRYYDPAGGVTRR